MKGDRFGRKRTVNQHQVIAPHHQGADPSDISQQPRIARSTVYKIIEEKKCK
ncbi:helix-turn-helix domain-containing protein [Pantoea stewartii]|uniref:helix-turn-helix domain-containing protein n=1 Tax=Pantoea stewartii TaxID=66269 RepID=UPI0037C873FB